MPVLIRAAGIVATLLILAACQVSGAAPPSSQDRTGDVELGAPGSNAP